MVGRVDVGRAVGAEGDRLPAPALAVAKQPRRDSEQGLDLGRPAGVIEIVDLGREEVRRPLGTRLDRGGEVDEVLGAGNAIRGR